MRLSFISLSLSAIFLLSMTLCSATQIKNEITQGDNFNVWIYCQNLTNSPCNSSDSCNFTLLYPNGSLLVQGRNTSFFGGGFFNMTLGNSSNFTIGDYPGIAICANSQLSSSAVFTYSILPKTIYSVSSGGSGYSIPNPSSLVNATQVKEEIIASAKDSAWTFFKQNLIWIAICTVFGFVLLMNISKHIMKKIKKNRVAQ